MKVEVSVSNLVAQSDVDALVNSANANLRLGSGVAGAIHTAAGVLLEEYCKPHAPLQFGKYFLSPGFNLDARWVLHVRASPYQSSDQAPTHLFQAISAALVGANENAIRRIAIPAIGTGVFKFPPEFAAKIMAEALDQAKRFAPKVELIRICVLNNRLLEVYSKEMHEYGLL